MQEMQEMWVWFLGGGVSMEEVMATHASILAWEIPWTEEPSRLQSMGSQRVGHDWAHTHTIWKKKIYDHTFDLEKAEKLEIKLPTSLGS